jgi:hypothetical protein
VPFRRWAFWQVLAIHRSETFVWVNTLEKVTPPKFSIFVLGVVSVLGSQS